MLCFVVSVVKNKKTKQLVKLKGSHVKRRLKFKEQSS